LNLFRTGDVRIAGTGSYAPARVVTNAELEARIPTTDAWIVENLGIRERRVAAEGELTSDLGAAAARNALDAAGLSPHDVQLIVVATSTPDRTAPSTACILQNKLGARNGAAAFDVAAVCSGFLYAMTIGAHMIASGMVANALVVGCDTFSRITDWTRRDAVFFGDGAGAVVLERTDRPGALFASRMYADGSGQDHFTVHPGDEHFTMYGRAVYETGTKVLPEAIRAVVTESGFALDDVACLIPHQPSIRILHKTAELLGIPFERVMTNMDRYANTSGATIPLLLDEVRRSGRIADGDLVAFAAVGSGWTWGAALLRWV
jgi:3-oxoacyl-[acyl-carrier-protein] synthase-3